MSDVVLAIDLGTSATKLLAVDRAGNARARRRVPHETHHPAPDAAEQDPETWWRGIQDGLAGMTAGVRVRAIGVTGQMHGFVILDDAGDPLRPAITWQDRRSATTVPDLIASVPTDAATRIAPGFQAASWHWLTRTEPETTARARHLLLPKDEVVHRLTGTYRTDPSDAIGTGWYAPGTGDWDDVVLDAAGAWREMLPEIVPSGSVAGTLAPGAATVLGLDPGVPVIIAGGDAAVAAFGSGATETAPLVMLSTGCQILQPARERPEGMGWPSAAPPGLPGRLRVATTLNGGGAVSWARATFGAPAAESDPELVFLPYLAGDRAPALRDATGAFLGLRDHHDRAAMSRAALDGVALALADAYTDIDGDLASAAPMLVGGGGSRDAAWLESFARAFGRPLHVIEEPDLSAWGAARVAATSLGWIDPVASPAAWQPATRTVEPAFRADASARLDRFRTMAACLYGKGAL